MISEQASSIYRAGLLQWQSYRVLEDHLDQALLPYKLSAPEWKTLGIIFDATSTGIRSLQIAEKLGVKPPLVTRILESLEYKKLVTIQTVKEDGRVRMVKLSKKGETSLLEASQSAERAMEKLLRGVRSEDRVAYKSVLLKILENGKIA